MSSTNKLRVAIPDKTDALEIVKNKVEEVTGLQAEPVFQELDHEDLIVEMQLARSVDTNPLEIAQDVERSDNDLAVLSTWTETRPARLAKPLPHEMILSVIDDPLPEAARRAIQDDVPTSHWNPTIEDIAGGDRAYWLLAVPAIQEDGHPIVRTHRRYGYYHRFSSSEVRLSQQELAS